MDPSLLLQLTGQSSEHIADTYNNRIAKPIHKGVVDAFLALQADASSEGYDLQIASGFRDFHRQMEIWNAKAEGRRALLDADGQSIENVPTDPLIKAKLIMRWSALPGASRHHWGTDIDIFDAAAVDQYYELKLTPQEVEPGGVFASLHQWLDIRIACGEAYGFYRPYNQDRGGIAPERWHLSYAPQAKQYERLLTPMVLSSVLVESELGLKQCVIEHIDALYYRFIALPELD